MNDMYTIKQVCELLGRSPSTVYFHCKKHEIGHRHGWTYILTQDDIETLRTLIKDGPGRPPKEK